MAAPKDGVATPSYLGVELGFELVVAGFLAAVPAGLAADALLPDFEMVMWLMRMGR